MKCFRVLIVGGAAVAASSMPTTSWAGPRVETSELTTKWSHDASKLYVNVGVAITVKAKVPETNRVSVRGECIVDGKRIVDTGIAIDRVDDLNPGDTKRVTTVVYNPMLERALAAAPDQCDFSIRLGEFGSASPPTIATYCWRQDASGVTIVPGRCLSPEEMKRKQAAAEKAAFKEKASACAKGTTGSCRDLARLYLSGTGTVKDIGKAEVILRKECDSGSDWASCQSLDEVASAYEDVGSTEKSRLFALRQRACVGGHVWSCIRVGVAYREGDGVTKDAVKSADAFEQACKAKNADACEQLIALAGPDASGDSIRQRACFASRTPGCTSLGLAQLARGELDNAALALAPACEGRDAAACDGLLALAARYDAPPSPNSAKAAQILERACTFGRLDACNSLGIMLSSGRGVPIDIARAKELGYMQCNRSSTATCPTVVAVAKAYADGIGVQRDQGAAYTLYTQACESGDAAACSAKTSVAAAYNAGGSELAARSLPAEQPDSSRPLYKRPWFWVAVVVVGAGVGLYASGVLAPESGTNVPSSTLGNSNLPAVSW